MSARVQPGRVRACRSRSLASPRLTLLHAPRSYPEQKPPRPRRSAAGMGDAFPAPSPLLLWSPPSSSLSGCPCSPRRDDVEACSLQSPEPRTTFRHSLTSPGRQGHKEGFDTLVLVALHTAAPDPCNTRPPSAADPQNTPYVRRRQLRHVGFSCVGGILGVGCLVAVGKGKCKVAQGAIINRSLSSAAAVLSSN